MDVKYKIIFFIFIIIAILYAVHFLSSWMSTVKRRESFAQDDDDELELHNNRKTGYQQENYVEAEEKKPITSESKDLNFRVKILEFIEDMKIKDKTIKGNLVDYLFSDPIIKTISNKPDKDVKLFIKSTYDNMNVTTSEKQEVTPVLPIKSNQSSTISNYQSQEDFDQRMDDLMSHVNDLQAKLGRLKSDAGTYISKGLNEFKAPITGEELSYPKPEHTLTDSQAKKIVETYEGIEGFENRRQYAFL